MTEPKTAQTETTDGEAQPSRAAVSIWLSARGERLYSVRVGEGADGAEIARLIDLALAAEWRLREGK